MDICPDVKYQDGHICKHNGTGDYYMDCPNVGRVSGLIPFMYRTMLEGKVCACGKAVGKLAE